MSSRTRDAVAITSARPSLSDDISGRMRRYLVLMGIRTVAFVLAVLLTTGWVRWVCIALAVFLPYIAVIIANGGRENSVRLPEPVPPVGRPELEGRTGSLSQSP